MICKLSDNRRDHETYAGGFQQEVERMGTDQGGEAKSKVVRWFALSEFDVRLLFEVCFKDARAGSLTLLILQMNFRCERASTAGGSTDKKVTLVLHIVTQPSHNSIEIENVKLSES